ncbi:ABC transporter ATP-binding protein [Jatrophihabitans sp. YIM 134969]
MRHAAETDPTEMRDPVLVARSVVKAYGGTPAVRGVSVHVERGEILTVTGPSGSGKSTLLLCLAGVLRPDAGSVVLRGADGASRTVSEESETLRSRLRRTRFGVLFQFGQLVPELTAAENVAMPLLLEGSKRRPALAVATDWLDRFEVADLAGTRPSEMSGGQAQRVAVARAMVTEPEVLFADEPTGALDTVSGDRVLGQSVRVVREAGTSVVLVTHDARVAAHGDREVVVRDGVVAGYELPVGV